MICYNDFIKSLVYCFDFSILKGAMVQLEEVMLRIFLPAMKFLIGCLATPTLIQEIYIKNGDFLTQKNTFSFEIL
jgi:hypothetical protein